MCAKTNPSSRKTLTEKQLAFAREYVFDFDATAAAKRAGYSAKTAQQIGSQTLQHPLVQDEIRRLTAASRARAETRAAVTQDEIIDNLTNIMRASISDVVEWGTELRDIAQRKNPKKSKAVGDEGADPDEEDEEDDIAPVMIEVPFVRIKRADQLPAHVTAAISEVSMSAKGTFKVKMHDKGAATDKLMRHLGLYEADNKQRTDPLAELIRQAQGTALPVATRYRPTGQVVGGADE